MHEALGSRLTSSTPDYYNMATVLPSRPNTNSTGTSSSTHTHNRRRSLTSSSKHSGSQSTNNASNLSIQHSKASSTSQPSPMHSPTSHPYPNGAHQARQYAQKPVKSQYPANSTEKHVEYILLASFDIDRGSVMEHQYPGPVGGDEQMLAELMLPDQAHVRSQDWTIFFLHKDAAEEPEDRRKRKKRRKDGDDGSWEVVAGAEEDEEDDAEESSDEDNEDEESAVDGPPLVYVLNLVNTKQDSTVKRGAVVKAMAVCTRHSFLHIYKPLLLLALQQYFAKPELETLASLYEAVNSMDLSLLPRLSFHEKAILQSSDAKDLFLEKFEAIIAQRMASKAQENGGQPSSPTAQHPARSRFGLPRDTHEFESMVKYANVPVPIKIPTALTAETVGDFSLIKLITTFGTLHITSPVPFSPTHPHLTTSGGLTHPIIVLLNALLTQKRIMFLGHNLPSSDVAEAVLGACHLASGGLLRGFTRHAFPYTDLTKIDDLLKVPGFIAGVTNPAFAHHSEWWDLLCDIGTGRMRISNRVEQAPLTEGVVYFQTAGHAPFSMSTYNGGMAAIVGAGASLSAGLGGNAIPPNSHHNDATGDTAFMANIVAAINERHGENAIRARFRRWVLKFTRIAAAFEETVYGATPLHIHNPNATADSPLSPNTASSNELPPEVSGHGYVWATQQQKNAELAANATRIEGWRNTRSYYNFIQDLAAYYQFRPVKDLDLQHLHDKLSKLRMPPDSAANIYLAICAVVNTDAEITQLLSVVANGPTDLGRNPSAGGQGQGLFYLALGLFHARIDVREAVAELLARVQEHEAGKHFWAGLGRFARVAWERVVAAREEREGGEVGV